LRRTIQEELGKELEGVHPLVLERPKERKFGHYATPIAFALAKRERKSPHLIAQELAQRFVDNPIFERVEPVGGYINFKLSESFLDRYATWALEHEERFGAQEMGERIHLEFVSANPTGPLHIGHARGAVMGEALARIGRHLGNEILKEYYINDAGNQIYLLGLSIYLAAREELGLPAERPEEYYRGEYIRDLAQEAIQHFGSEAFEREEVIEELAEWGKDRMMELIRADLARVGITFDRFVSEKALYQQWDEVLALLKERGAIYERDGKLWLRSSLYGDEKDRVVVREDGRPTYLAGDIIYHYRKFQEGFDRYINIWGADHHGYIPRLKAAIKFLGFDPQRLEVLLAQMVSLLKGGEPFKMSKRAGTFILMRDVVEEMGADALKFIFLSKKSDTHLEFDIDLLQREDSSNPIYYINYAHARVHSLLDRAGKEAGELVAIPLEGLNEDAKDLLFSALLLPEVLEDAFTKREVQRLTDYLKALAAQFHSFYNKHKVIGSEYEERYLKLSLVVALSIRVGLRLLGIEAKRRM